MWFTKFPFVWSIVILGKLSRTDTCKFGVDCDYPCHCQEGETCGSVDGSCPAGCDDGNIMEPDDYWHTGAWTGYGCQFGNVAYDKTAEQGSTNKDHVARRAIDGNHDPVLGHGHCAYVKDNSQQNLAWWQVDLWDTYVVISIIITNRRGTQKARTTSTDIYVSEDPGNEAPENRCYYIGAEGEMARLHVNCSQPMVGQYVKLKRRSGGYQNWTMNVCEVQVIGYLYKDCPDEYFGVACGTPCNCRVACDDITGECPGQNCLEGWTGSDCQTGDVSACTGNTWGYNCVELCNCQDIQESCNRVDGSCLSGCRTGYEGTGCNLVCSGNTWGDNCQERCNCQDDDETCNHIDGSCPSGCRTGYEGIGCNLVCPENTWGDNCEEQCNCQDDQETCNHVDGSCPSGCKTGYEGTSCNTVCTGNTWGDNCQEPCNCQDDQETCDHVDGSCVSGCTSGYEGIGCNIGCTGNTWGDNCEEQCNCQDDQETCDHVDGSCHSGCSSGYEGTGCNIVCAGNTWGDNCREQCNCQNDQETCDNVDGSCQSGCRIGYGGPGCKIGCTGNTWGDNCEEQCNCQDDQETCDHVDGSCHSGCSSGYEGTGCNIVCAGNTWGDNCREQCNCQNDQETCDNVDGSCQSGCRIGYGGPGCKIATNCPTNMWGDACQEQCNCQDVQEACHPVDGSCRSGCSTGFGGTGCNLACDGNTWGDSCQGQCNCKDVQETCNHIDGSCQSGCRTGYEGTGCNVHIASSAGGNSGQIVGAVMAFIVVAILVVVILFLLRRYLKRKKNSNGKEVGQSDTVTHIYEDIENGHDEVAVVKPEFPSKVEDDIGVFTEPISKLPEKDYSTTPKIEPEVDNDKTVKTEETVGPTVTGESVPALPMYDEHIYGNEDPLERPIPVNQLASYIDDMASGVKGFAEEFAEISTGVTAVSDEGKKQENKTLNRFKDICAYDHSRVVLKESEENRTGYINANYIHRYKEDPNGYIATQGPTKSTLIDFWSMVWQTNANRIVMVTNLCEANKVKCEQYWPDEGVMEIGKFKLNLVNTEEFAEYTIRVLSVMHEKSTPRAVYHFHFTGWPDNAIPEVATSLLNFRRKVRSRDDIGKGPIIVHCSAGIGRTGTFLAIDYLLEQAKAEGLVDVFKYTSLMRSNRMDMIQTKEQYEFVYKALLEALQAGETTIPSNEMETRYSQLKGSSDEAAKSKLEEQFMLLQRLKSSRTPGPKDAGLALENIARNRDNDIVPSNRFRVHLKTPIRGTNDYINAVSVDGYRERRAYIATQLPLPDTVVDLWRLLYDHKCSSISLLEQPNTDDESTPIFWPISKDKPVIMRELTVSLLKDEELDEGAIHMMEFKIDVSSEDPHTVRLYQFTQWAVESETPSSMENTLQLFDHLHRWRLRSGHGAVCFQCKYGFERSGLMIAACYMLEKLKVDREVDVFQAVKQVRVPRPQLVTSLVQYEFLHELAIAYINSFEDYANFK